MASKRAEAERASSSRSELQVFDKFYRVRDVYSGEPVLERAGTHPNFAPSSRFIGAFAEGEGFEVRATCLPMMAGEIALF